METYAPAGAGSSVRRVTAGPEGHFFGYYDMPSWDQSGRFLLAHRVELDATIPGPDDAAAIGTVDLEDGCRFDPIATTRAWSWQQGSMLHWLSSHGPRTFIHNDVVNEQFVACVRDLGGGSTRTIDRPVAAVGHDERTALSLNFARLCVRPEVGYPGVADPWEGIDHPADDGIHLVDLHTGSVTLIVSLETIAAVGHDSSMDGAINWVNHLIISPDDSSAVFVHRWWPAGAPRYRTRFMMLDLDDNSIREIWPTRVSHMCWRSPTEILFSGCAFDVLDDPFSSEHSDPDMGFRILNLVTGMARAVGVQVLPPDGHCTYRPGGRYVLMDTPVAEDGMRELLVFDEQTEKAIGLGRFHAAPRYTGAVRCDLHPRWNHDGTAVCIDSVHEGSRQMYVLEVSKALDVLNKVV